MYCIKEVACVKKVTLKDEMRLAWVQHIYWTRLLLVSIAERLNDLPEVQERLMRNPDDISAIYAQYYSPEAAENIRRLITEHLRIGGDLITALRDGETERAEKLTSDWYINAGEWADALTALNPHYNHSETHEMLYTHLDLITNEVGARLSRSYQADIDAFNAVEREAMAMADYLTCGIVEQFPQVFE